MRDLLLLGLVWVFLVICLAWATRLKRPAAIIVAATLAVGMVIAFGTTSLALSLGRTPYTLMLIATTCGVSVFLYLCIGLVPVCAINLVWWLAERRKVRQRDTAEVPLRREGLPVRVRAVRGLTLAVLSVALAITGIGLGRAQDLSLSEVDVHVADLPPSFDGVTIALITDLHLGATTVDGFMSGMVASVNEAHPDLIIIAGDLVDGSVENLASEVAVLGELRAPLGVVVTTGNHEFYGGAREWMEFFSALGLTVLDNDGYQITRGSDVIEILGINDLAGRGPLKPDPDAACERAHGSPCSPSDNVFRILAAHQPRQVRDAEGPVSRLGIDLQVSGHTHGGQLWPLGWLVGLTQPMNAGAKTINSVVVVTSRGAGTWGPPVRVGADPEIPIITVHRA